MSLECLDWTPTLALQLLNRIQNTKQADVEAVILGSKITGDYFGLEDWIYTFGTSFPLLAPYSTQEDGISWVLEQIFHATKVDVRNSFVLQKFIDPRTQQTLSTSCGP